MLGADGRVTEQGSYDNLIATSNYANVFDRETKVSDIVPSQESALDDEILQDRALDENDMLSVSRKVGDKTVYRYYFQNVGWVLIGLYLASSCAFVFGLNFPRECFYGCFVIGFVTHRVRNLATVVDQCQRGSSEWTNRILARHICCTGGVEFGSGGSY